ncbi:phage protein Gp27 family protein [Cellulosilyticum sp. I15G10I2]|uniref:phage protein Gp27 family protein n=1 Tax=Cellulosilyticum sp. I15G10I2 TaxID=1892843 RepID=UPI00085C29AC|nr:phage protein Gp27 family protein [Cellulosilyticum sp. I15G10I2]
MSKQRQRKRTRCKIDDLPEPIKNKICEMISDTKNTYTDIAIYLYEQGFEISRSSVGRYALRSNAALERLQEAQEQTRVLIEAVKNNPEVDYTEAGLQIMIGELTKKMATAQEEFDEMPLDKAGRLLVATSRTNAYKEKLRDDMRSKAELAFEKMEDEILKTIKADEELATQLHNILLQAKEKMMQDD